MNSFGQLGLGNTKNRRDATPITCLRGSPIVLIACGAYHSLIISKSGYVKYRIEAFNSMIFFSEQFLHVVLMRKSKNLIFSIRK
jgi:hypothetical protein